MIQLSFGFILPYLTGHRGLHALISWLVAFDTLWAPKHHRYGVRVRFCGFTATIDLFFGKIEQELVEIRAKAMQVDENGEEKELDLPPEMVKYFEFLHSLKVRLIMGGIESWDAEDKSFTLPDNLGSQLNIGDRIMFGTQDSGIIVTVTGSRKLEDDKTLFYGKFAQYVNARLNEEEGTSS